MVGYVLRVEALNDDNGSADTCKLCLNKTLWIPLPLWQAKELLMGS